MAGDDPTEPPRPLGALQQSVMEAVWELGECTIRQVVERLSADREIAFNTVMTVMNRLLSRGLLQRSGERGHYVYRAACDEVAFQRQLSRELSRRLVEDYGTAAVVGFVDSLEELDPTYLDELRRIVSKTKRPRGTGTGGP